MKFFGLILVLCASGGSSLEVLDQLASSLYSFHHQIHQQTYDVHGRIGREVESALPSDLESFELVLSDMMKDLTTIEQSFNSVPLACQQRMPSTPTQVRSTAQSNFQSCSRGFYNQLRESMLASIGYRSIVYEMTTEHAIQALERVSRERLESTSVPISTSFETVLQELNQKRLAWDNGDSLELYGEFGAFQGQLGDAQSLLAKCFQTTRGRAGADIGDIFISLWDC
ncbi:hypothetical protein DMENIID0001_120910 [Sergentomyia squamirostris]